MGITKDVPMPEERPIEWVVYCLVCQSEAIFQFPKWSWACGCPNKSAGSGNWPKWTRITARTPEGLEKVKVETVSERRFEVCAK